MRKSVLLLVSFVFTALACNPGQGIISGKVVDFKTGKPISGVIVKSGEKDTASDTNGDFAFTVAPGKYGLMFMALKYENYKINNLEVNKNETMKVSIALVPREEKVSIKIKEGPMPIKDGQTVK